MFGPGGGDYLNERGYCEMVVLLRATTTRGG